MRTPAARLRQIGAIQIATVSFADQPSPDEPHLSYVRRMAISNLLASRLREVVGLPRGVVLVLPANPAWAPLFHLFAAELLPRLPPSVVTVEHVGSTAVPGLAAKPILDVAVGVRANADPDEASQALENFGFLRRGDHDGPGLARNFGFELEERVRLLNVHMVTYTGPHWIGYLAFRDRLRADSHARDEYASIKRELAEQHSSDRQAYLDGKAAFVAQP